MSVRLTALILGAILLSLIQPGQAQLQDPERDKKLDKKSFDRDRQGNPRAKGPYSDDRRNGQPKPFMMAGDPRFEQMLKLALVDQDKLDEALEKWPRMNQMSESDKRKFVRRVSLFREKLRKEAMEEARQLGLEIPDDEKVEYFRSYWTSRMQLEQEIRQQAKERHETEMKALRAKLQQQWGG